MRGVRAALDANHSARDVRRGSAFQRNPSRHSHHFARTQADLCIKDPGFEVDLCVEADLAAMARVWLGDITFEHALRSGEVQLTGSRKLAEAFPAWLLLSHFAVVPRPKQQAVPA